MKQNTTPTLPVRIHMPLADVKHIEFIFKEEKSKNYPALLYKKFDKEDFKIQEEDTSECFLFLLPFTAEETMAMPEGEVYMDTLIELNDGKLPETEIVKLNVNETLFEEVYESGRDKSTGNSDD